jgi:hypothetical protein
MHLALSLDHVAVHKFAEVVNEWIASNGTIPSSFLELANIKKDSALSGFEEK